MKSIVLCVVLFLAGSLLADDEKAYYLYVAAESQDQVELVRFDGNKAEIVETISVGVWPVEIEGPHGLTVSEDGKHWYLSMAHGKPYGHVYKYTTDGNEMLGRVELAMFPATLQESSATGFLYVVNFNLHGDHVPSTVSVVDPETMTEIERIETGIMPHGSRVSPDGRYHYSCSMMTGEVIEVDALSMTVTRRLFTGEQNKMAVKKAEEHGAHSAHEMEKDDHAGHDMKKAADEHAGHDMEAMDHSGHDMDKTADEHAGHDMKKTAHSGHDMSGPMPNPTWVYPHPSEKLIYVANNGADNIVEIDVEKWAVKRRFKTGKGPYNVEISNDGKYMAATYKSEATTAIWDLPAGKELAVIPNTRKVSHGVIISPDSRYAFVSVEGIGGEPGALDVIDLATRKLVATVDTGKQAGGIAFWKMEQ